MIYDQPIEFELQVRAKTSRGVAITHVSVARTPAICLIIWTSSRYQSQFKPNKAC